MNRIKKKFTQWYVRKGYRISLKFPDLVIHFDCPILIRPLLFLFSPSVYHNEQGRVFADALKKGIESGIADQKEEEA